MTIAFLAYSLSISGGAERMLTLIANELVRREGMQVDIICVNAGEPFFELDPRIGVVSLNQKSNTHFYRHYPRNVCRLRRVLRRRKYDRLIDVCVPWSPVSILASMGLSAKNISWEHLSALNNSSRFNPVCRWMAACFAHRVVVLTDGDKATYEQKFGAKNVVRISNPVTIDAREPSPLKDRRFLAIGRFSAEKGFDMLLDAWALTRCRREGWSLRIVGSGPEERRYREQIERLGIGDSVEMLPPTRDIQKIYREASVYVLSSRTEGLPLVLIEATAMGLPVVSFDCSDGPREIIRPNKTGVLVTPEDVTALAAAMDEMAADEGKRKCMSAEALVRSRLFSVDAIMAQWIDLLKR